MTENARAAQARNDAPSRSDPSGTVRRRPLSGWLRRTPPRHKGLTVALLGVDGAGKTTLARALSYSPLPTPVRSQYMGLYGPAGRHGQSLGPVGRVFAAWARCGRSRVHIRRGEIVIFDRYTYDVALAAPHDPRTLRRAYRSLLVRTCPDPDLVVVLDVPAEVAQRRKEEHSLASLTEARRRYLELGETLPQAVVVDASRSAHDVQREVEGLVRAAYLSRRERA
jgi:hypothetical protein